MDKKQKKRQKQLKRKAAAFLLQPRVLWTVFVFCSGVFAGIHRNVIKAKITGAEMPEVPEGHCSPEDDQ